MSSVHFADERPSSSASQTQSTTTTQTTEELIGRLSRRITAANDKISQYIQLKLDTPMHQEERRKELQAKLENWCGFRDDCTADLETLRDTQATAVQIFNAILKTPTEKQKNSHCTERSTQVPRDLLRFRDGVNTESNPDNFLHREFGDPASQDQALDELLTTTMHQKESLSDFTKRYQILDEVTPLVSPNELQTRSFDDEHIDYMRAKESILANLQELLDENKAISPHEPCPIPEAEISLPTPPGQATYRRQMPKEISPTSDHAMTTGH
ncbi:hypothetical protein BJ085DRAFT_34727 [Dimargaris cristalligena]|uniref:Uncharacterized protein n=1 Tax=Dimargaris cristalligena TaxID=215637 RepID=A0A4P9ZIU5_9FUNG|nr:hypothetical protein BJ085DRAFT_34727 [Dimargaris cristalligena]|eukprot:RKP33136.1 hypothetical protein BJ085DRAFT_34727 [Dimargaris cristalligena]